jgi:hypothetical protein
MLAAIVPLLPLLAPLVPRIAEWFGGEDAAETAVVVQAAVVAVAGSTDPSRVAKALQDPTKAAEMVSELAKIAADREAARDRVMLDTLKAELGDVADARRMASEAAPNTPQAMGAALLTGALMLMFSYAMVMVLQGAVLPENNRIADMLLGALFAWVNTAVSYWLGTSRGAQIMRDALIGGKAK